MSHRASHPAPVNGRTALLLARSFSRAGVAAAWPARLACVGGKKTPVATSKPPVKKSAQITAGTPEIRAIVGGTFGGSVPTCDFLVISYLGIVHSTICPSLFSQLPVYPSSPPENVQDQGPIFLFLCFGVRRSTRPNFPKLTRVNRQTTSSKLRGRGAGVMTEQENRRRRVRRGNGWIFFWPSSEEGRKR